MANRQALPLCAKAGALGSVITRTRCPQLAEAGASEMLGGSNKPLPCLVEPLPVEADLLHLLALDPLDLAPSRFAFLGQVFKPKQSDGTIDLEERSVGGGKRLRNVVIAAKSHRHALQ